MSDDVGCQRCQIGGNPTKCDKEDVEYVEGAKKNSNDYSFSTSSLKCEKMHTKACCIKRSIYQFLKVILLINLLIF